MKNRRVQRVAVVAKVYGAGRQMYAPASDKLRKEFLEEPGITQKSHFLIL